MIEILRDVIMDLMVKDLMYTKFIKYITHIFLNQIQKTYNV